MSKTTMQLRFAGLVVVAALLVSPVVVNAASGNGRNFVAHLSAATGVSSRGEGEAIFQLSPDGKTLYYKLIVANINNVFMAHIHLKSTGKIVVWMFPSSTPNSTCIATPSSCEVSGRSDGVIAQGSITAVDFVGSLAGMSMSDLIAQIQSGNTFVNVHTIQNPGGEIQGPIS